jgi:prepilin-type N-terminal cleavage/methylation domain-containing protein/prepilin-type processing-associated H-X9-DG protein
MSRGRGAFTLAELLVVVAIISILAAMLFPVLSTAKRSALRADCANNFHQVGLALYMYTDDNNGRYPMAMAGACPSGLGPDQFDAGFPSLAGLIYPLYRYCKTPGIWMCKSGPKRDVWTRAYTSPRDTELDPNWYMVGWVKIPDGPWIETNYVTFPFNRHPETFHSDGSNGGPSDSPECAQGRTPAEYISLCGHVFSKGAIWEFMQQPKLNGRLLQDCYYSQGKNPYWAHQGGTNVLYYDGRTGFVTDPRTAQ